jgi:aspartate/methionine/tyrosine aminotransferase
MNQTAEPLVRLASRVDAIEPFYVMELMKEAQALKRGVTQYTNALGIHALREAISQHYRDTFGLAVDPERIVVTAGASAALLLACMALVDNGDEVLMPDPCYPCNRHFVSAADGKPVLIASGPAERFQLTAEHVEENWSEKTRGVLLASPSNPTGTSIEPNELRRIVDTVRARGGFTIVDEIYQGLSYDAKPVSALSFGDDVVTVNSFSKYFNMTGWRLGWLVVPHAMVSAVEKLSQNLFICASALAQHAALACFEPETIGIYEARRLEFKRRRDYIVPALRSLGFGVPVVPDGAFYVYADTTTVHHPAAGDSDALTHSMLHDAGVVLVPGADFGFHAPQRYIRLSYATSQAKLEEGVQRLGTLFRR